MAYNHVDVSSLPSSIRSLLNGSGGLAVVSFPAPSGRLSVVEAFLAAFHPPYILQRVQDENGSVPLDRREIALEIAEQAGRETAQDDGQTARERPLLEYLATRFELSIHVVDASSGRAVAVGDRPRHVVLLDDGSAFSTVGVIRPDGRVETVFHGTEIVDAF